VTDATAPPPARRRRRAGIAVIGLALLAGIGVYALQSAAPTARFVEYPLPNAQDAPVAIAAAADGTIWFTIDRADAIGRLRGGRMERLPIPGRNFEPLGLAIAADGSAWYTDSAAGAVVRIATSGEASKFALEGAITRLGRLAMAPDGSAWFADATGYGITQLQNGTFKRHESATADDGPYGVAVSADGIVWASLQRSSKLMRIAPGGATATIELPRRGANPTDVAVGTDGSIWFLQFRANRLGRLKEGKFSEFEVGGQNVGLSGLAVAADGAVWFGMVRSSSLGRLRDGKVATFKLPRDKARPYSVAVDPEGNVWYADISGYVGMLPARYARAP
jgi:virginiamycin B lyase